MVVYKGGLVMHGQLSDSVGTLRGVGPKKVQSLNKLGINTIADLLGYYPFRYDDIAVKSLAEVADGQKVALKGIVASEPVLARFWSGQESDKFSLLGRARCYFGNLF